MGRRFQIVANTKGIKIIDDYAHHPTEIKTTLDSIKNITKRKIAIFQPHRYTRLKGLWNEFLESFNSIDKLYVIDVFNAGDKPLDDFNSKNFAMTLDQDDISAIADAVARRLGMESSNEIKIEQAKIILGVGSKRAVWNIAKKYPEIKPYGKGSHTFSRQACLRVAQIRKS